MRVVCLRFQMEGEDRRKCEEETEVAAFPPFKIHDPAIALAYLPTERQRSCY